MKNNKIRIFGIILLLVFSFISCDKENVILEQENQVDPFLQDKQLTLNEFIKSVETDEERNFFKNHKIIDNRSIVSNAIKTQLTLKTATSKPKIKFRWDGCKRPLGICLIIPLETDDTNASAIITENKYIIFPKTDDNGLTIDGYLPIYRDLYVDENTTIKAGIYKANYDKQLGKYTAVALDIK